jgi:hypothetical protein
MAEHESGTENVGAANDYKKKLRTKSYETTWNGKMIPQGILSKQPDIWFNETLPCFKTSPHLVKSQGLFPPSGKDSWKSVGGLMLEVAAAGMYMKWKLKSTPHCQMLRSERGYMNGLMKKIGCGEPTIITPQDGDYIQIGNFCHFPIDGEIFSGIEHHLDGLEIPKLIQEMEGGSDSEEEANESNLKGMKRKKEKRKLSDRGPNQRGLGYAAQNTIDDDARGGTCPQVTGADNVSDLHRAGIMTNILKQACVDLKDHWTEEVPEPYTTDPRRTKEFAQKLVDDKKISVDNVFEHLTISVTNLDRKVLFRPHIDQLNCSKRGFDMAFVVYTHIIFRSVWYRLALIGYSRACVAHYYTRQNSADELLQRLKTYFSVAGTRQFLTLNYCLPKGHQRRSVVLPNLDKNGFCSGISFAISSIANNMEEADADFTVELAAELLLPVVWVTSHSNLFDIYMGFSRCREFLANLKNRTECLSVLVVNKLVEEHGGLSEGEGKRFQLFLNSSLEINLIYKTLDVMRSILLGANDGSITVEEAYKDLAGRNKVYGVNEMGAQIFCKCAALSGLIPAEFAESARVYPTTSAGRWIKNHYNLGVANINRVFARFRDEVPPQVFTIDEEEYVVFADPENTNCESIKEFPEPYATITSQAYRKRVKSHVNSTADVYHKGQTVCTLGYSKMTPIAQVLEFYQEEGQQKVRILKMRQMESDENTYWVSKRSEALRDKTVVKVTPVSVLDSKKKMCPSGQEGITDIKTSKRKSITASSSLRRKK